MDRNTLLAFLLISLVLVFTPKYLEIVSPNSTEKVAEKNTNTNPNASQAPEIQNNAPIAKPEPVNNTATTQNTKERLTEVKTDLYTALISNLAGGSIKEFHIKINEFSNTLDDIRSKTSSADEASSVLLSYLTS